MKKIIISTILLFTISFCSIHVFAATVNKDVKNNTENAKNSVLKNKKKNKNVIMNTGNSIGNGVTNAKNAVVGSTQKAGNTVMNAGNSMMSAMNNMDNNYNAQRTAADVTVLGMSTNTWTWLILAIVGIAIVGLVWYYGAQYEHRDFDNE